MANKKQRIIVEKKDFPVFLAARTAMAGSSISAMAELLGVGTATVYNLLAGSLEPNEEILKRAGLRMVYVLEVEDAPPPPDEPPAKPAKGKKG